MAIMILQNRRCARLGAEIFFEKVSLKPGKPTVFAKLDEYSDLWASGKSGFGCGYIFCFCSNRAFIDARREKSGIEKRICKIDASDQSDERTRCDASGFA